MHAPMKSETPCPKSSWQKRRVPIRNLELRGSFKVGPCSVLIVAQIAPGKTSNISAHKPSSTLAQICGGRKLPPRIPPSRPCAPEYKLSWEWLTALTRAWDDGAYQSSCRGRLRQCRAPSRARRSRCKVPPPKLALENALAGGVDRSLWHRDKRHVHR